MTGRKAWLLGTCPACRLAVRKAGKRAAGGCKVCRGTGEIRVLKGVSNGK